MDISTLNGQRATHVRLVVLCPTFYLSGVEKISLLAVVLHFLFLSSRIQRTIRVHVFLGFHYWTLSN